MQTDSKDIVEKLTSQIRDLEKQHNLKEATLRNQLEKEIRRSRDMNKKLGLELTLKKDHCQELNLQLLDITHETDDLRRSGTELKAQNIRLKSEIEDLHDQIAKSTSNFELT